METPVVISLPIASHSFALAHVIPLGCSKMFIGGLNWETDDSERRSIYLFSSQDAHLLPFPASSDSLQGYFSQFGRVASSSIMRDPSGRSRGFAFLTFEDPASVNAVMAKEHVLDGKIVSDSNDGVVGKLGNGILTRRVVVLSHITD
jgi:RNA recognition motif-containing protein